MRSQDENQSHFGSMVYVAFYSVGGQSYGILDWVLEFHSKSYCSIKLTVNTHISLVSSMNC
jgi:hypothetical protein